MKTLYRNIASAVSQGFRYLSTPLYGRVWAGLLLCSLSFSSCMDLEPKDSLGDNIVWSDADNFQLFANQFYAWTRDLQSSTDYQNGLSDGVHSDYRSDLCCAASINVYSQGTNSIPASDGNFTTLYKRIYYTNLLLSNAKNFGDQSAIATPKGEALWFRAYLHFELVQIYGDCQLLTQPLDIDAEELYGTRNDRTEVIDQCVADLQEAAELLPDQPSEEGRLCKDAARALLSRIALYEGTWQKFHEGDGSNTSKSTEYLTVARDAAKAVMDNGRYSLFYNNALTTTTSNQTVGNIEQSYRYMFILEDAAQCNPANLYKAANTEYILAHRHRDTDRLGINLTHAMSGNACYVTSKMATMYLCQDGLPISKSPLYQGNSTATSEFLNRDARMDNTMLFNGEINWDNDGKWRTTWTDADESSSKTANVRSGSGYQTQKWAVEREVDDYYESVDYPVIRYAEVLLNYAEAVYELSDAISDSDLDLSLNLVRLRANPKMTKLSNSLVTSNSLSMREEIRRERTVELFLEGFRIDDLKRWKTAEEEMPEDLLGVQYTNTWFATNWSNPGRSISSSGRLIMYSSRSWAEKNYLYPLPSDQLQLNPNLTQNPGWTN
ncbi:MAG: RagB/SusD family nutrient uptake outer membrane protein [Prevotella sp.]|nr:RagB/SusD family nutrient uptake outer membrane protein [Prevotella sp.]